MRCLLMVTAAALAFGLPALAQEAFVEPPEAELSAEDRQAAPLPPGLFAGLTKEVCTECHDGNFVVQRTYTPDQAVRYYKIMVTENIETEQARQIIHYLSTTLAPK